MTEVVTSENEISLNSIRYPIKGRVSPSLISVLPGKVTIGDYSLADEQIASTWVINDQRGGLGVEEMDETIHQDRYYWSTCDCKFKGHITLPPLATQATLPAAITAAVLANGDMETNGEWSAGDQSDAQAHGGTYSWLVNNAEVYDDATTWATTWQSKVFLLIGWMYSAAANYGKIGLNDGKTSTYSSVQSNTGSWEKFYLTKVLASDATRLRILLTSVGSNDVYFDDLTLYSMDVTNVITKFVEYGGNLYMSKGNLLSRLDRTAGASFNSFAVFPTDIVDMYVGMDASNVSHLLIGLGDADDYWYITETVLENCDDAWNESHDSDATSTADSTDYKIGKASVKLVVVETASANDILATEVIASVDLRGYNLISFWIKSSIAVTVDQLRLRIDETAECAGADEAIRIPALAEDTWAYVTIPLPNTVVLNAVVSIGLEMEANLAAFTVRIDDVRAYKIAETNQDDFTKGIYWDAKCQKTENNGQLDSTTAPAAAAVTWVDKGKLYLDDGSINNLVVYRDADADPQVYAGTKEGLWVHDYTNEKWIETELHLPKHPTGGKGLVNWRDALYISSGLHVDKYVAGATATIASVGMDRDDGLPSEFSGEINAFVDGHNQFHALVDSSLVTGVGYSGVYDYKGTWHNIWCGATSDDTTHCGIESTVYAYRLWFDHDDKVYSIPLLRGIQSPLKIDTYTYALSGMHITPWFDGAWIGNKLALSIKMMCGNTLSDTEKITAYYRIDHSTTTIPVTAWTGWTKLISTTYADGVTADGEATFTFGTNAVGIEFKAIQFAFYLERTNVAPATDKIKTPDLQYVKFKYLKLLDTKWGWMTTIDCSLPYKGNTPHQLITNLRTAVDTATLKEFTFRDESGGDHTEYVGIANAQGLEHTGHDLRGQYAISLVSP